MHGELQNQLKQLPRLSKQALLCNQISLYGPAKAVCHLAWFGGERRKKKQKSQLPTEATAHLINDNSSYIHSLFPSCIPSVSSLADTIFKQKACSRTVKRSLLTLNIPSKALLGKKHCPESAESLTGLPSQHRLTPEITLSLPLTPLLYQGRRKKQLFASGCSVH